MFFIGGLIPKIMYDVIIPQYKKNPLVKKLLNEIMDNKIYKYKSFFNLNLNKKGVKLVKFLSRYFDEDFKLTMKDRVLSPNYYQYDEKKLIKNLNKLGLKKHIELKKVQFNNIRALVAPMYYEYDHLISRVLYGDGDIAILSTKTK